MSFLEMDANILINSKISLSEKFKVDISKLSENEQINYIFKSNTECTFTITFTTKKITAKKELFLEDCDENIEEQKQKEEEEETDKEGGKKKYELLDFEEIDPKDKSETTLKELKKDKFTFAIFVIGLKPKDIPNSEEKLEYNENSNDFPSVCNHTECSLLNSFIPSILSSYKNDNENKLELNDLMAQMCFPLGIKLCYLNNQDNPNEKWPMLYGSFVNSIKNIEGETFYMVSYFYFHKMKLSEFEEIYKTNSFKKFMNFLKLCSGVENNNDKINQLTENMDKLAKQEVVLIPECISIISKFPYIDQMKICLQSICTLKSHDLNYIPLINHIVNEVPIPAKRERIMFYLPTTPIPVEILPPIKTSFQANYDINYGVILDRLSNDNIILIFHILLSEKKVIFLHSIYSYLSDVLNAFLFLLYPLQWAATLIQICCPPILRYVQSPTPYIIGMDESIMKLISDNNEFSRDLEDVAIINLNKGTIGFLPEMNGKTKKFILNKLELGDFPNDIYNSFYKGLDICRKKKKSYINKEISKEELNSEIQNLFLESIAKLIGEYNQYLFIIQGEQSVFFDTERFLNEPSKVKYKKFYTDITGTQMFWQFLNNEKLLLEQTSTKSEEVYDISLFKDLNNQQNKLMRQKTIIKNLEKGFNEEEVVSKTPMNNESKHFFRFFQKEQNIYKPPNTPKNKIRNDKYNNDIISDKDDMVNLLIPPFFIMEEEDTFEIIENRKNIEKYIEKNQLKLKKLIFEESIKIENMPETFNKYIYQFEHYRNEILSEVNLNTQFIDKKEIKNLEKDKKDKMIKWYKNICTSKENGETDIKDLLYLPEYRSFLCMLIKQVNILDDKTNKILTQKNFNELLELIIYTFSIIGNDESRTGKILTLALFSYCYKERNTVIFLYKAYNLRKIKNNLWYNSSFWLDWYFDDIKEKTNLAESIELAKFIAIDKMKEDMLKRMTNIMLHLNLDKGFVKEIVYNIGLNLKTFNQRIFNQFIEINAKKY